MKLKLKSDREGGVVLVLPLLSTCSYHMLNFMYFLFHFSDTLYITAFLRCIKILLQVSNYFLKIGNLQRKMFCTTSLFLLPDECDGGWGRDVSVDVKLERILESFDSHLN